ncbi:MAG: UbiA family prenyltransferase [Planctomycetes bacterium]|nr:UbiA family prenyltransferase [Planctomycetota bacterium]
MKLNPVVALSRPFTLLAPALGMVAFGCASLGWRGAFPPDGAALLRLALGALMAAVLNVASNAVNQICDLEVDRINKPTRPLPAGEMTVGEAWVVTVAAYVGALALAAALGMTMLLIVAVTAFLTYAYSAPPFRTKRHWFLANFTIAIPRGFLLPIAGWVAGWVGGGAAPTLADIPRDAWILAGASGLFILGAASTKDFADMAGDKAGGCITLPLRFGVTPAARSVAPFLFAPWAVVAALRWGGVLGGNAFVLVWGPVVCAMIGLRTAWLLVRDPASLTSASTHPSWVLMYLLMLLTQVVTALAYTVPVHWMAG